MSLNGMATIGADHPLYGGVVGEYGADCANRILLRRRRRAGRRLLAGQHDHPDLEPHPGGAQVIQVDIDGAEIGRNFECAVPLVGDAGAVIGQLAAAASSHGPQGVGRGGRGPQGRMAGRGARRARRPATCRSGPSACSAWSARRWRATAMVVGDTGHVGAWSARHLRLSGGQSVVRAAGSLGWGLPASLGVKCAVPRPRGHLPDRRRRLLLPHRRAGDRPALRHATSSWWSTTTRR